MNRRPFLTCLLILCALSASMQAQSNAAPPNLHEGIHFEVAFPVVWATPTESPLPQPLLLVISSRYATKVKLFADLEISYINKEYMLEPNKILRVEVKLPYLSPLTGGKRGNGLTLTSNAPMTVATYAAYQGNGNLTLHYPVETWGTSYHVFSNPQDEYGVDSTLQRRPGQIVVIAAEDNTVITIKSPVRVAGNSEHGVLAPNAVKSIKLMAHETMTFLAAIDSTSSHTASTDLTGTRIISTKPVAVLSGHTKGAVSRTHPMLPPVGSFSSPAHFIRNSYYQALLPDAMADTSFVTIPMRYTSNRSPRGDDPNAPSDVVRIVATKNATWVRRSKNDGSGYATVAVLDSGRSYTDTLLKDACRWTTSKPALVMQYGKSYVLLVPLGGETQNTSEKVGTQPQGHPTVVAGMPTMMVVPGESQWIERGTYYAPEGMDNFVSIVMKTQDVGSVLIDGKNLVGAELLTIPGTDLTYTRLVIKAGDRQITTFPSAKIMAWSHGSLDGLQQGRAYGHPVGVNTVSKCTDQLIANADQFEKYTRANVKLTSDMNCSSLLRYEIVSSQNAVIDHISFYPDTLHPDSMSIHALPSDTDDSGSMTVRFTSTSGRYVDVDMIIPSVPRLRSNLVLEIAVAKRYDTIVASVSLDSTIDSRFTRCTVYLTYDKRLLRLVSTPTDTPPSGNISTPGFRMSIPNHAAGTMLGTVAFVHQKSDPNMLPSMGQVKWYEGNTQFLKVNTFTRIAIIDTIVDTVQVSVESDDDQPLSPLTLTIHPQPAHDFFEINFRKGSTGGLNSAFSPRASLRIFDVQGVLMFDLSDQLVGEQGTVSMNTSAFASGMYLLHLSDGMHACTKRMVIE